MIGSPLAPPTSVRLMIDSYTCSRILRSRRGDLLYSVFNDTREQQTDFKAVRFVSPAEREIVLSLSFQSHAVTIDGARGDRDLSCGKTRERVKRDRNRSFARRDNARAQFSRIDERVRGNDGARRAATVGGKTSAAWKLYLIHTFAFESGNLCARRSETECTARGRRGRRSAGRDGRDRDGACVPACARKRHERRHYNRYVSMQTLSFIRLPVVHGGGDGGGGDPPGPSAFSRGATTDRAGWTRFSPYPHTLRFIISPVAS